MKVIGLIGGISWLSTAEYYRRINQSINIELGGLNFAHCLIYSFNYAEIKANNDSGDWDATLGMVTKASQLLEASGAKAIILCANTMHYIADQLQQNINVPIIHIASVAARQVHQAGIRKVGLLGTKFTMELDFFSSKFQPYDIEVLLPDAIDRNFIHQTIFDELGKGFVREETRQKYLAIIHQFIQNGAEGIILGCTELGLMLQQDMVSIPLFDTTAIHADAAVAFSLGHLVG
jgi:aspartate racemase